LRHRADGAQKEHGKANISRKHLRKPPGLKSYAEYIFAETRVQAYQGDAVGRREQSSSV
jgi:hypothetical protein